MKTLFLLRHGWAENAEDMRALGDAIRSRNLDVVYDDLGFYGAPQFASTDDGVHVIEIGHSYGFATFPRSQPSTATIGRVSLCGFTRFFHRDEQQAEFRALRSSLQRSTHAALSAFRNQCGLTGDLPGEPALPRLLEALDDLATVEVSLDEFPVLALVGGSDRIVTRDNSRAMFMDFPGVTYHEHRDGGHDLGSTYPQWCAQRIIAFADAIVAETASGHGVSHH